MKFKAKTKAGTLLDWLRAIRAVSDDCVFDTSELDVVEVRVVDPANAQMVMMRMPDHVWDLLEVEAGRIGIDLEQLIAKVELFDPDASITITTGDHKVLDASGVRTWLYLTDGSATFGLEPLDTTKMRKPPAEPELGELPAMFLIDAELLRRAVRRAESVSNNLLLGVDADGSVRIWTAEDHEDYSETLPEGEVAEVAILGAGVRSMFAIDYLREIVAVMHGGVAVLLGQDKSVTMSFTLHDASVTYIQAPRIE